MAFACDLQQYFFNWPLVTQLFSKPQSFYKVLFCRNLANFSWSDLKVAF
jgi:hypothetical protein